MHGWEERDIFFFQAKRESKLNLYNKKENIPCVILAGGRGSRLDGKGKYAQKLLDISLLEHVFNRIKIQTNNIAINFKSPLTRNIDLKAEIIYDSYLDDIGPLAGIHSALKYAYKKDGPTLGFVWIL